LSKKSFIKEVSIGVVLVVAASVIAIHTAPRAWSSSAGHLQPNCEGHQLIIAQVDFECEFMKLLS
jgi:hypothetical protein